MTFNLYTVRDIVADDCISVGFASSDGAYIRDALPPILSYRRKEDLEVYKIGTFDSSVGYVSPVDKVAVSWDSYKFPENNTKTLTKEQIIELANRLNGKE